MAEILVFPGLGYECNSYLIVDKKIVLIDTGTGSSRTLREKIMDTADKIDLIINTHAHLDHVGGNSLFSANVAIHEADAGELESGSLYGTADLFGKNSKSSVHQSLSDAELIDCGEMELKVIHTPGHTPGGICLLSSAGHLFSGDTVFSGGSFGRVDLAGGSASELIGSLERLKCEDFEFLMPGHMESVKDGKAHLEVAIGQLGAMYERR